MRIVCVLLVVVVGRWVFQEMGNPRPEGEESKTKKGQSLRSQEWRPFFSSNLEIRGENSKNKAG